MSRSNTFGLVKFVAPDDNRLERERALAESRDHRFPAGLDPFRDGDLAFTREKLDRPHFAQIHAHGIVGSVSRLLWNVLTDNRSGARSRLDDVATLLRFLLVMRFLRSRYRRLSSAFD